MAEELVAALPSLNQVVEGRANVEDFGSALNLHIQGVGPVEITRNANACETPVRSDYWSAVKHEVVLLLCTKDRKYTALRSKLRVKGNQATPYIVSSIALGLVNYIGVSLAALTPLVITALYAVATMGLHAWCEIQQPIHNSK